MAVLRCVPALQERGWSFVFWTPLPGSMADELEARGYEYGGSERLMRYRWRSLREDPGVARRLGSFPSYLREFAAFLDRHDPAVVHANTLLTIPELLVARRHRRPTVMHVHEMLPSNWKGAFAGEIVRRSTRVVLAPSGAAAGALAARGVPATIVNNSVDPPSDPVAPSPDGRLVIGTLGVVCRQKGSDLFLAAADRLSAELPDVEFRMIGPLPDGAGRGWGERVVAEAHRRGIAHDVVSDSFGELAGWDMLVEPSRTDAFPLSVLEAMSIGLPVVVSEVDGLAEMVTPDAGILVPPEDPAALAAGILELARDPARRAELGAAGRRRVAELFTSERQADGVERAYLRAVGGVSSRLDERGSDAEAAGRPAHARPD